MLLLRGDFLYDQRIVKNMVDSVGIVLEVDTPQGARPVAAHVTAEVADRMEAILSDDESSRLSGGPASGDPRVPG